MASNIRLRNLLALHSQFAKDRLSRGESLAGLEGAFASTLDVRISMWSQIKAGRTVGDILARQFENLWGKPKGWLDEEHPETAPDPSEEKFLELCRKAWQFANKAERANLKKLVKEAGQAASLRNQPSDNQQIHY